MTRREFMMVGRRGERGVIELSCERLYMRFVDARGQGTTAALFARLDRHLAGARELRLVQEEWLGDRDLRLKVEALLTGFRARGGRVTRTAARVSS